MQIRLNHTGYLIKIVFIESTGDLFIQKTIVKIGNQQENHCLIRDQIENHCHDSIPQNKANDCNTWSVNQKTTGKAKIQ
jgi:hypothetical protein